MGAQITAIVLMALAIGMALAKHGEPRDPWHFGHMFIAQVIWVLILWWGGFWGMLVK